MEVFVLKDQGGNYVSHNSISYDQESKQVIYSYSPQLTNGYYTCSAFDYAQTCLDRLNQSQKRFKLNKEFHIEKIATVATYTKEDSLGLCSKFPIRHECIDFNDNERWIWILKDSKGNFANANSVCKWNKNTWLYVTFKTFGKECRGYVDQYAVDRALTKLYSRIKEMGIKETFRIEYVKLSDVIKQNKAFEGENMVVVEKKLVA